MAGRQTGFIDTGRYMPTHIGFDKHQTLWGIGWQRDEIRNEIADREDYFLVRRYSKAGAQDGAFIPRSTWKTTGDPAGGSSGFWHMAFASDRIGAIVYDNWHQRVPEWIEWDLDGNLFSRTPMDSAEYSGGRAYTSSGELYAGVIDAPPNQPALARLDRQSRCWQPVTIEGKFAPEPWKLLIGADGDQLVFKSHTTPGEYVWMKLTETRAPL